MPLLLLLVPVHLFILRKNSHWSQYWAQRSSGTDTGGCLLSLQFQWKLGFFFQKNTVRSKFLLDFLQWTFTSKSKPRPDINSPWFFLIALSKLITHVFQHRWYRQSSFPTSTLNKFMYSSINFIILFKVTRDLSLNTRKYLIKKKGE